METAGTSVSANEIATLGLLGGGYGGGQQNESPF